MFLTEIVSAQVDLKGRVLDKDSGEPVAFAAVVEKGTSNGAYSDIDGYFRLRQPSVNSVIMFSCIGYNPLEITFRSAVDWNILLQKQDVQLNEVVILPGENPAERILRKAIENKKNNNPEGKRSFTYDSYNKLIITPDEDSAYFNIDTVTYNQMAKGEREYIDIFRKQHLMIMESISQRRHLPPDNNSEKIIASRVSGLQHPEFALLATQMQSFSFYNESINVMDVSYFSPIANGAISKYLFVIEDTTFVGNDTVFAISFRPRKGKNFDGLKGQLYIHTHGYAIQNVIAEPAEEKGSFGIKIQQQYRLIGETWFPDQLNTFLKFPSIKMKGIGKSYINNVQFDVEMTRKEFSPVIIELDENAYSQTDSLWDAHRNLPLDSKEKNTYHVIDSLGKAENLDDKLAWITHLLVSSQIRLGIIDFDLLRLASFNNYEGFRLGGGIHTNEVLSKWFTLGGYYAYGFKDKQSKFGGDAAVNFFRERDGYLKFIYEQDVRETAGNILSVGSQNFLKNDFYPLLVSRMDRYEKREIQLNGRIFMNISVNLFFNNQLIKPYHEISFQTTSVEGVTLFSRDFTIAETGVNVRYAPGEKIIMVGEREVRLRGRWPIFFMKYTMGMKGVLDGEYDYNRYDFLAEKKFRIINGGDLNVRFIAGVVENAVPFSLLYNMKGSYNIGNKHLEFLSISAPYTFETMRVNAFQNSQYAVLHLRHQFKDLLFKRPKFAPHISLVHNMGWGRTKNTERYGIPVSDISRGYVESGIVFDRLLDVGSSMLGIGFFYHYGPYRSDQFKNNFSLKLSAQIGN
ncbi:MAG: carboxypeptidase-like regulatory domain-containing protein [Crocinitomicaceae bacterium]|nr:carboxypeptidase-like regulatory domain-containing protein [Crocinitomicaceae bacterium]